MWRASKDNTNASKKLTPYPLGRNHNRSDTDSGTYINNNLKIHHYGKVRLFNSSNRGRKGLH